MSLSNSTPLEIAKAASLASRTLAVLPTTARNEALTAIHAALIEAKDDILAANRRDVELAKKAAAENILSQSVLGRLDLARKGKWEDMLQGILDVRNLEDPVGKITLRTRLDEGLILERMSCPIGVLLIIFEARPEVLANITSLAIKSGNTAILKGGMETTASLVAISTAISKALSSTTVPSDSIQLVRTRDTIKDLLVLDTHIDLVIPRGSNELVRYIKSNTKIPVLGHADGICSIYLAADADPAMAVKILVDAKTSYPSACNAVETLLVDHDGLTKVLPSVATALCQNGVSLRCDPSSLAILTGSLPQNLHILLTPANELDYTYEFLSLTLAIKSLPETISPEASLDLAVAHINSHSSHHTDAIITASESLARRFQAAVDSACVFWNTSTRMADGMRFGFGTEVGISTNKIHARGPVGVEGLMIYKYLIRGQGQVAGDYGGAGGKKWVHERMALD